MKIHTKCKSSVEKLRGVNNTFVFMFYATKFYICWFIFTWTGRFLLIIFTLSICIVNLELHAMNPAAKLDGVQKLKMQKLEKNYKALNSEIADVQMLDNFSNNLTWQSKRLAYLQYQRQAVINAISTLKNKAFNLNGFDSWENRLMNALPTIWIINSSIKRIAYNEHIKYYIRQENEKKNEKLHKK